MMLDAKLLIIYLVNVTGNLLTKLLLNRPKIQEVFS